jgi:hypothetical protein
MEEKFIVDSKGRKVAIQVPIGVYKKLLSDSEELEEIKEYRKAKARKGDAIPFEQAFREIEDTVK